MTKSVSAYSTEKALYHKESLRQLRRSEQPVPVHVELIISDFCNHDCKFCAYRMQGYTSNELFQSEHGTTRKARNPRRYIDQAKCREILGDCSEMGVKAVQFTGGGEPTIHPNFCEVVSYAQSLGLETSLVTNGNMLTDSKQRHLIKGMEWVRVSIDASTEDHYRAERGVGSGAWRRLEEGVKLLTREVAQECRDLVIGAGFVVTPRNWIQVEDAARLYKSWGFQNIRFGLMFSPNGLKPFESCINQIVSLVARTESSLGDESFQVINRIADKAAELSQGPPDFEKCGYMHFTTYIGGDQNVYVCCVNSYNKRGSIGSIQNQTFKQLWESDEKERFFKAFDARGCARCQFSSINRTINSVVA